MDRQEATKSKCHLGKLPIAVVAGNTRYLLIENCHLGTAEYKEDLALSWKVVDLFKPLGDVKSVNVFESRDKAEPHLALEAAGTRRDG